MPGLFVVLGWGAHRVWWKMSAIKSKARVRERGEVFTADREVNAMLNHLPSLVWKDPHQTFLEPSCGNGQFLAAILQRKLDWADKRDGDIVRKYTLALSTIYGIDIMEDNVRESRTRMRRILQERMGERFTDPVAGILDILLAHNIQCGNTLEPAGTLIVEWAHDDERVPLSVRAVHTMASMQCDGKHKVTPDELAQAKGTRQAIINEITRVLGL